MISALRLPFVQYSPDPACGKPARWDGVLALGCRPHSVLFSSPPSLSAPYDQRTQTGTRALATGYRGIGVEPKYGCGGSLVPKII